ncbi:MAG: SDR family NAD(P)-dependent oxidoreductase [Rhizobiaceae bacterium]
MDFAVKYGPWAIVAGGSEGPGLEYSRQIAARGVNVLIVAHEQEPLDEASALIRSESQAEVVTALIDLNAPDADRQIIAAAGSREVGLYISNAGGDASGRKFHDADVQWWIDLATRNNLTMLKCFHHFGGLMKARGRGGLLISGSGACYGGGPHLAMYCAVKAFSLNFAEGLWAELKPHGVNVLCMVMDRTDTKLLRGLLAKTGAQMPPDVAKPADVAAAGLARLAHGPVSNWGLDDEEAGWAGTSAAHRRVRVEAIAENTRDMYAD